MLLLQMNICLLLYLKHSLFHHYKVIGILWGGSPEQIDRLGLATKSIKALELVKYYKEHYKKKH